MTAIACAHPACPGRPTAWLAFDYEGRCAWLDDEPADGGRGAQWPLCKRHADSLRVPRGWFSIDRRATRRWEGWPGWDERVAASALNPPGPQGAALARHRAGRSSSRGLGPAEPVEAGVGAVGEGQGSPKVTAIL
jgi:hypothetical protein